MTIDEATKILKADKLMEYEGDARKLEDAIQLGIEALKRVKWYREWYPLKNDTLLPGETGE